MCFTTYGFQGLMQNNFHGNEKAIFNGQQVLKYFDILDYNPWIFFAIQSAFAFGAVFLAWSVFKYKNFEER